jgi:hypothetical protein
MLDHLSKCGWLDSALRKRACSELGKNAMGPSAHISLVDDESHIDSDDQDSKLSKSGVGLRTAGKKSHLPAKGGKLPVSTYVGEGRKLLKENGDYRYTTLMMVPSG